MSRNRSLLDPEILEVLQNILEDQLDCEQTEEERHILQSDSDSEERDYNAVRQESDFSSDMLRVLTAILMNTDGAVSSNGVLWSPGNLSASDQSGRRPRQNVLTEEARPTSFSKRSVPKLKLDISLEIIVGSDH
ncbi:hypothetical protein EVAR_91224_1 [Eumeta japonica]|uniref:Uncharacterized protein n=1 Tax=Eumeta variegata TaxID=151549 RepID=A0A4C2A299_EUMVA|nr:hypothetical protein EVAR_91224_1 [Eumeta japonica]